MKLQHYGRATAPGLKHLALTALLAGAVSAVQAQALNYPVTDVQNVAGTYTDLGTAGTVISTTSTDDANSSEQSIGFNFPYNGATVDRFILNTNGFLKLGSAGMAAPDNNLYTTTAQFNSSGTLLNTAANHTNLISPFNFDLVSGSSTAEYRMATTGTAGSRVCTIQWKNVADKAKIGVSGGATVENQFANFSFQVKLYENGIIEFIYGPITPAATANNNFKYAQVGIKGSGNSTNQIIRLYKGSVVAWSDAAIAAGPVTAGATGAFNFRQAVPGDNGRTFRFVPTLSNDASVGTIYTVTKLPIPGAAAHAVRAVVRNSGTNAKTNIVATLNVTGANTFTDTQTIPSLAPGASTTVTFAAYTPTTQGNNVVSVSIPADDNPFNNQLSETQQVNATTFSYSTINAGPFSAVGYPEDSEAGFAAKYSLAVPSTISAVRAYIFDASPIAGSQKSTVGQTLYGVVVDPTSGVILARSADFVVGPNDVGAMHDFVLPTPFVAAAGNIMVGMVQVSPDFGTGEAYYPMGVQNENPTRPGTFYRISINSGAPVDISAGTGSTNRYMLDAVIAPTTTCTAPTIATFPYTQNFDVVSSGQVVPCGITVTDSNNDGFTWKTTGTVDGNLATGNIARSAPNAMVYSYNNTTQTVGADDWFFTPALTLSTGQRYRVSFYYRTAGQGLSERLEVKSGTAATPAGQTNLLYTNNSLSSTTYQLANNTSTPAVADITPASGTYYVGFHATSLANQGFLAIDDLTITASPLATSEALKRAVSVFPNPSNTGSFNLEIHGANAKQAMSVEVTNMLGQRVYTGSAKDNFSNTVDLSTLTSGIYTLKVRNGQEYTQQQISIVK